MKKYKIKILKRPSNYRLFANVIEDDLSLSGDMGIDVLPGKKKRKVEKPQENLAIDFEVKDDKFADVLYNFVKDDVFGKRSYVTYLLNPQLFYKKLGNSSSLNTKFALSLRTAGLPYTQEALMNSNIDLLNVYEKIISRLLAEKLIPSRNYFSKAQGLTKVPSSRYYDGFKLNNSSQAESVLFSKLHELGLNPVPESFSQTIYFSDTGDEGYIVDFILPCQVCKEDGTIVNDVLFVGEYFGRGKTDLEYAEKKVKKKAVNHFLESLINQKHIHFETPVEKDTAKICEILGSKNIVSRCNNTICQMDSNIEYSELKIKQDYIKTHKALFIYVYVLNVANSSNRNIYQLRKESFDERLEESKQFVNLFDSLYTDCNNLSREEIINTVRDTVKQYLQYVNYKRTSKAPRF